MKNCGKVMRILSVVILSLMLIGVIINYSFSATELEDARDDLEESIAEHEIEDHDSSYDRYNCSECESYREREEDYDRREISLFLSAAQSFLLYMVFCGILYALGEVLSKMGQTKPQEKPGAFCTNCGKTRLPGTRFCAYCGKEYEE